MADDILKFIEDDPAIILQEIIQEFNDIAGWEVGEADPEMFVLTALAYREASIRSDINYTGRQNFLRYASGSALDEKGYEYDTPRLDEQAAQTTLKYYLAAGHPPMLIPKDNFVKSADGTAVFKTVADTNVNAGVTEVEVIAECTLPGQFGNDYESGTIITLLDPLAYMIAVENTTLSSGGADRESDEEYKERISLARAAFSCAGPEDAYRYWAKSAHPKIVDVQAPTENPGEMSIYALMDGGTLPSTEVQALILEKCSGKKVVPKLDTVLVKLPNVISYDIIAELTLHPNAIASDELGKAYEAMEAFRDERKNKLGLDVVREYIISLLQTDKVYKANVVFPAVDIIAAPSSYTSLQNITITIAGVADE